MGCGDFATAFFVHIYVLNRDAEGKMGRKSGITRRKTGKNIVDCRERNRKDARNYREKNRVIDRG